MQISLPSCPLSVPLVLCPSVRLPFLVGKGRVCTCLRAPCVWACAHEHLRLRSDPLLDAGSSFGPSDH